MENLTSANLLSKDNCKCIDCGGTEPRHSSDCAYMNELHGIDLLPLQLFLAKQLTGIVPITEPETNTVVYFRWANEPHDKLTPREWDYVCRRIEEKLTFSQQVDYVREIAGRWDESGHVMNEWALVTAPWPTRTIALMKVFGETK